MRRTVLLLSLLVASGCGELGTSPAPRESNQADTGDPPPRVTRTRIEPTTGEATRPATPEEFLQVFAEKFDADPEDAFVELTYWGYASQQDRLAVLKEFMDIAYLSLNSRERGKLERSKLKVMTVGAYGDNGYLPENIRQFEPGDGPDKVRVLQHEPTHILEVVVQYTPNMRGTSCYAFGERNGRYYFCSTRTE